MPARRKSGTNTQTGTTRDPFRRYISKTAQQMSKEGYPGAAKVLRKGLRALPVRATPGKVSAKERALIKKAAKSVRQYASPGEAKGFKAKARKKAKK